MRSAIEKIVNSAMMKQEGVPFDDDILAPYTTQLLALFEKMCNEARIEEISWALSRTSMAELEERLTQHQSLKTKLGESDG